LSVRIVRIVRNIEIARFSGALPRADRAQQVQLVLHEEGAELRRDRPDGSAHVQPPFPLGQGHAAGG
jgi:hypothetical protein